jgi:hypothetical protein
MALARHTPAVDATVGVAAGNAGTKTIVLTVSAGREYVKRIFILIT